MAQTTPWRTNVRTFAGGRRALPMTVHLSLTTQSLHGGGPFMPLGVRAGDQKWFTACRVAGTLLSTRAGTPPRTMLLLGELPLSGAWGLLPARRTCPLRLLTKKWAGPPHSRPPRLKARARRSGRGRQGPQLSLRRGAAWDSGSPRKVAWH